MMQPNFVMLCFAAIFLKTCLGSLENVDQTASLACGPYLRGYGAVECNVRLDVLRQGMTEKARFDDYLTSQEPQYRIYRMSQDCPDDATNCNNYKRLQKDICPPIDDTTRIPILPPPFSSCQDLKGMNAELDGCCLIFTPDTLTQPNNPQSCKEFCDLDANCTGFSNTFGECILTNVPKNVIDANDAAAKVSGVVTPLTRENTLTNLLSIYRTWFKTDDTCDYFKEAGKPCIAGDGYLTRMARKEDFSNMAGWVGELPVGDGKSWHGVAPAAFDEQNIHVQGGLEMDARLDQSFGFPVTPASCSCSFHDYTTGIMSSTETFKDGLFETKIVETASGFANAFWMQGLNSEVNIIRIEGNQAIVSAYCFDAKETTFSHEDTVEFNDGDTVAVNLQPVFIEWLINGKVVSMMDRPPCLRDQEMNLIFSVEASKEVELPAIGTEDPETGVFGSLRVEYLRIYEALEVTAEVIAAQSEGSKQMGTSCAWDSSTMDHLDDRILYDQQENGKYKLSQRRFREEIGTYEGQHPGEIFERGQCGMTAQYKKKRMVTKDGLLFVYKYKLSECGALCIPSDGCRGFFAQYKSKGFLCSFFSHSLETRTNFFKPSIMFMVKPEYQQADECLATPGIENYKRHCHTAPKNTIENQQCSLLYPVTIDGVLYKNLGWKMENTTTEAANMKVKKGVWIPKVVSRNFQKRFKLPTKVPSAEVCAKLTDEMNKQMRELMEYFISVSDSPNIPLSPTAGCHAFTFRRVKNKFKCVAHMHTEASDRILMNEDTYIRNIQ
eukprot:m.339587 g.339587  ORF g.339587 m.339587 type:complete len:779 (-) comp18875_c0_seq1:82-2418(-)